MDLEALCLIISHEIAGRELTQVLEAAESWGKQFLWLCEQQGRPLLLVPVLPEPPCTEPPSYAPERLEMMSRVIKDPQSIDGNCPQGDRYVLSWICSAWDQHMQVMEGAVLFQQHSPSTKHCLVPASVCYEEVWACYSPGSEALPELRMCKQPHHLPTLESPPFC